MHSQVFKYKGSHANAWHLAIPERLPEGEAVRIVDREKIPELRIVLYHGREGAYFIGPDILIPYVIAYYKKLSKDNTHRDWTEYKNSNYGTCYIETNYNRAVEKFNELTGLNFVTNKMETEKNRNTEKLINKALNSNKKRGRQANETMLEPNARQVIYAVKAGKKVDASRVKQAIELLVSLGFEKFVIKSIPNYKEII